jgi:hypothetical protein
VAGGGHEPRHLVSQASRKEGKMTNWRKELTEALSKNNESWASVESNTLSDEQMDREFDDGYGGAEGDAFTVWTAKTVYFPVVYDGAEWVGRQVIMVVSKNIAARQRNGRNERHPETYSGLPARGLCPLQYGRHCDLHGLDADV